MFSPLIFLFFLSAALGDACNETQLLERIERIEERGEQMKMEIRKELRDELREEMEMLKNEQRDHKGSEFRTWSGSGPKCQKWSGIGPELGTRSGFGFGIPL